MLLIIHYSKNISSLADVDIKSKIIGKWHIAIKKEIVLRYKDDGRLKEFYIKDKKRHKDVYKWSVEQDVSHAKQSIVEEIFKDMT